MAKSFELRYSPLFYDDLDSITDYIVGELKNPSAAKRLINDVEAAIKKHLASPTQAAIYKSVAKRKHAYRRIIVGNYLIFYVVIDNTMVVRRMLYGRRDLDKIL
jgi:addiction module RelE/StbE family toxin